MKEVEAMMRNLFMDKNEKLVFWGVGHICKACMKEWSEIRPVFCIDSKKGGTFIDDIEVRSPETIDNWNDYFINITVQNNKEIKEFLHGKGLKEGENFVDYNQFFGLVGEETVEDYIVRVKEFLTIHNECKNPVLWFAPTIGERAQQITNFIKYYYTDEPIVVFTRMIFKNPKKDFRDGRIYKVDNYVNLLKNPELVESNAHYYEELPKDKQEWITELTRATLGDASLKRAMAAEYALCEQLVEQMRPAAIIVWGGWVIRNYVLAQVAKEKGIQFAYAEYGELPGTIKIDFMGIEGKGEYAQFPERLLRIPVTEPDEKIVQKIGEYIRSTRIDSLQFEEASEEQQKLASLDKNKKRVFFVGMDDNGKEIRQGTQYWKEYLSLAFDASEAVASELVRICNKNGWDLIVKPHPYTKFYVEENENIHEFFEIEIDQLIQNVDAVVSITSKADYKTLIYGKPLVQVGQTSLTGKGCGYEVFDCADLEEALDQALSYGMTEEQKINFDKHLAQLLKVSLWYDGGDREFLYGLSKEKDFWEERI